MTWLAHCNRCGEVRREQKKKPTRCHNMVRLTPHCERRCDRNLSRIRSLTEEQTPSMP